MNIAAKQFATIIFMVCLIMYNYKLMQVDEFYTVAATAWEI